MYIHAHIYIKESVICFGILASAHIFAGKTKAATTTTTTASHTFIHPPSRHDLHVGAVALRASVSKFWLD